MKRALWLLVLVALLVVSCSRGHGGAPAPSDTYDTASLVSPPQTAIQVQNAGANVTKRSTVNFTGAGVMVADDATHTRTTVTIPGGVASAYQTVQSGGTAVTQRSTLNFTGSLVSVADDSTSQRTTVTLNKELPASPSQGDIAYFNGSAWQSLSAGTSGQVLQTNGAGANPSWASVSSTPSYTQRLTALDSNHIHAWSLTETSGNFADTGNTASPLTLVATPSTGTLIYGAPGIVGPCVYFSGKASAVATSIPSDVYGLTTFTMEAWVKVDRGADTIATAEGIWGFSDGSSNYLYYGYNSNVYGWTENIHSPFWNGASTTYQPARNDGVWQYVALTYDSVSALKAWLYVDGQPVNSFALTANQTVALTTTSPKTAIAYSSALGTNGYVGYISRVRFSNIARSQTYLNAVYQKANFY